MVLPTAVKPVEVGPRDGLQNEPMPISTAVMIELGVATFGRSGAELGDCPCAKGA